MRYFLLGFLFLCTAGYGYAARQSVYVIPLHRAIDAPAARIVSHGLREAHALQSDYILLHLNTYGGELQFADSIRSALLHCSIPTLAFIDHQAASAGALIAIACDSIYMRSGGSIGAATVVDQSGAAAPDKYQSFMRSMMRSTAAAHGKRTTGEGRNRVEVWRRDPLIAEAMVDPRVVVPGLVDSTQVLTLTVDEAIANGYCEGRAESIDEALALAGLAQAARKDYQPSWLDAIILFLMNPVLQGLLLMLIIGGIYFELQSPGVGFPLAAAVVGALLYFAPLYLEGLAEHWELLLFVGGVILLAVELFVVPGFGVTGIAGILSCIAGLLFAMIDNHLLSTPAGVDLTPLVRPLFVLSAGLFGGLVGSIYLSRTLYPTKFFGRIALKTDLTDAAGYVGVPPGLSRLIGATGVAHTVLRPSGKIRIDGELYDAVAEHGMINRGQSVRVTTCETGQLYCIPID
jgi:membrane-bound serine protease (ClpP class)